MSYLAEIERRLQLLRTDGKQVALFGTGAIGAMAYIALDSIGVKPVCFMDNNLAKQGTDFYDTPVVSPDDAIQKCGLMTIVICAASADTRDIIKEQLLQKGCEDFIEVYTLSHLFLKRALYANIPNDLARDIIMMLPLTFSEELSLSNLELCLTEKCTLRCRYCANMIPYFHNPEHIDKDIIIASMRRLLKYVDYIELLAVLGGEPFIYPDLKEILYQTHATNSVGLIRIVTNGTILPKDDVFDAIKETNTVVFISYYDNLSVKTDEIVQKCTEMGITCVVSKSVEWNDLGEPVPKKRSDAENNSIAAKCHLNRIHSLIRGKFYRCSHASYAFDAGVVLESEHDFVDVLNNSDAEMFRAFLRDAGASSSVCAYCNGFGPPNQLPLIKPAEQC